MKRKYRIVSDEFAGYEVQSWIWYWPFWCQVGFTNTWRTVEDAKSFIDGRVNKIYYP